MQFRNNIINTALLGTEKKQLTDTEFPEPIRSSIGQIVQEDEDNETKFLKTAALALSFYKAGLQPLKLSLAPDESPDEILPYCSSESLAVLKETLYYKYNTLTWFWCKHCAEKKRIVQPQILPYLFEWGVATKKYAANLFRSVIGNRGLWLSKFSDEWKFVGPDEETIDWETGSLQQRLVYIKQLRSEKPSAAMDKILAIWKEENAANRVELLEIIHINISKQDEKFLLSLFDDKSQKVKQKAWDLLKLIPDSQVILTYEQTLKDSIVITQSKMLGLINKTNINVKLSVPDDIFKTGIQNLSNNKNISDDDFILMQLIAEVPPAFWETHFNCNASDAVKIFTKDELKKFQMSVCTAVLKFKNKAWSKEILENFSNFPVQLLQLQDEPGRSDYAEKILQENNLNEITDVLRNDDLKEWSHKFARKLLSIMADNPSYNRNYFEQISIFLPSSIVNDLNSFTPQDEWKRNYWSKTAQEIKVFIAIKEKIKNIF